MGIAKLAALLLLESLVAGWARADDNAELLKKLRNPVANLVSVPLRNSFESGVGPNDAFRYTLSVEPLIPFELGADWLLVTRPVLPLIAETPLAASDSHDFGLGDTQVSFYFSPSSELRGWVLGAGPIVLLPTATDSAFAGEKWGAGPTAVVVKQVGGWTAGLLADHIWSFAGSGRDTVSQTFLDPWLVYSWPNGFSLSLETESLYDWNRARWTVPVEAGVSQVTTLGGQNIELGLIGLYYPARTELDPRWGVRLNVTFIFEDVGKRNVAQKRQGTVSKSAGFQELSKAGLSGP